MAKQTEPRKPNATRRKKLSKKKEEPDLHKVWRTDRRAHKHIALYAVTNEVSM